MECAFEANEGATKQKKNQPTSSIPSNRSSTSNIISEKNVAEENRFSTNSSKNFTTCHSDASIDDVERMRKSRYEIPDNQLSRKAVNILAGKKEVEMHEFYGRDDDISECDDRKLVLVPNIDPSGDRGDRDSPENV